MNINYVYNILQMFFQSLTGTRYIPLQVLLVETLLVLEIFETAQLTLIQTEMPSKLFARFCKPIK